MKTYTHNPNIYREHYGNGLPGFHGTRMQYGHGWGTLARRAIPLLKTGVKIIAPHLKKAAKEIAKDVGGRLVSTAYKRKAQQKPVIQRKKFKVSTSKRDIFN